jgi:hypothetical protein
MPHCGKIFTIAPEVLESQYEKLADLKSWLQNMIRMVSSGMRFWIEIFINRTLAF